MTLNDTLTAYEDGLITEDEALEQAFVDRIGQLYDVAAAEQIEHVAFVVEAMAQAGFGT